MAEREFDLGRSLAAVLAAAPLGGALTAMAIVLSTMIIEPEPHPLQVWLLTFLFVSLYSTVVFAIGLALVATPGWLLLRKAGLDGWLSHSLFGAAMTGGTACLEFVIAPLSLEALASIAVMAVIGGVVGATMWRIAYRD